ncbi:MAG: TolC family protein [Gammaproteobacteria bacterium]|nr:TolC family protein [Gammaproteobacteria bacterium]
MRRSTHLLLLLFAGLPAPALSETLEDAWAAALESHRQVAAATAYRDAATFELEQAKSARLPQLGLSSGYTMLDTAPGFALGGMTTGPVFDGDDFVSAGAAVRVPLYSGGAIASGIEAAEFGAAAADGHLETVIQDVRMGVAEHYVAVLRAESAVTVARSYVASLSTHTTDTRNRFEIGDVPRNDYLAASVTLADAEQRLMQAENGLDYARSAYNRFLGRPLTAPVAIDSSVGVDGLLPAGVGLEELISIAGTSRHELAALGAEMQALERQAERARASARPQLALTGGYTYLENQFLTEDRFWSAGVAFQWNLFDGGQASKQSASLEQRAAARGHDRADLESLIALEVRRAWNDRLEAESRLAVADRTVEQAAENLRVVTERYDAGAGTNVEVLDAAALREQSMSNRDNAKHEVLLAKVRLARAAGLL